MLRFTTFTALALLSTGLSFTAEAKDKPPQISVCAADVCLAELRWTQPSSFLGTTEPAVDGVLINISGAPVSFSSLNFALEAGPALLGTAADSYSGAIPPGGRWHFHASFSDMIGGRFVMKIHAVQLAYTEDGVRHAGTLEFDPLFGPLAYTETLFLPPDPEFRSRAELRGNTCQVRSLRRTPWRPLWRNCRLAAGSLTTLASA